ncbi:outer membrane protein assembly factor BamE [Lonsdalea quercina]|uniref:outer membrane protein assembly factor BamE domain-containing protein n=1 Tax=Lonsdalea quercina TaxID=71657 RepID=UPI003976F57E
MKRFIFLTMLCVFSIVSTACAPTIKTTDYNQKSMLLSLGMTKNDVMQVMGAPRRTDVNESRERWIYWNKVVYGFSVVDNEQIASNRLVVTFVDGKVKKWGQQTMTDDIMESSQKSAQVYAEAIKKSK